MAEEGSQKNKLTFQDVPYDVVRDIADFARPFRAVGVTYLEEKNIPQEIIERLVEQHKVDPNNMKGESKDKIPGTVVRGIVILDAIADDLQIDKTSFFSDDSNRGIELQEKIDSRINKSVRVLGVLLEGVEVTL